MKTYLAKERLDAGGYNARGRYFGVLGRTSVYRYDFAGDSESGYLRARSRDETKQLLRQWYPQLNLSFFR
jgi:hypothetical protein